MFLDSIIWDYDFWFYDEEGVIILGTMIGKAMFLNSMMGGGAMILGFLTGVLTLGSVTGVCF